MLYTKSKGTSYENSNYLLAIATASSLQATKKSKVKDNSNSNTCTLVELIQTISHNKVRSMESFSPSIVPTYRFLVIAVLR